MKNFIDVLINLHYKNVLLRLLLIILNKIAFLIAIKIHKVLINNFIYKLTHATFNKTFLLQCDHKKAITLTYEINLLGQPSRMHQLLLLK